jgi:hypothetical protein
VLRNCTSLNRYHSQVVSAAQRRSVLTCGMCCTAHQRRTSAGECPPHAQHGDFSIQQLCHPSDTDELDLCTHNSIGNRLRLQLTCCVEFDCQRRVLSTFVAHTNHMSTDPLVHYSCRGGRLLILMPACRLPATNRKLLWARRKRTPVPCIQCCQPMPMAGKAAALRQCCCCYPSATAAAAKLLLLCAVHPKSSPTKGAAMSLCGKLYCTERALGPAGNTGSRCRTCQGATCAQQALAAHRRCGYNLLGSLCQCTAASCRMVSTASPADPPSMVP